MKEFGGILLILLGVVILGNLWFSFVEGVLAKLKGWLFPQRESKVWHTLSPEKEDQDHV